MSNTVWSVLILIAAFALVPVLAGALLLSRRWWKTSRRRRAARLDADRARAAALWRAARERLAKAGLPLSLGATPREAAQRSSQLGPQAQAACTRLIARYLESRWGGAGLRKEEARELLRGLERAL